MFRLAHTDYYVFNHDDLAATDANRTSKICRHQKPLFNINKNFHFTVIGEWSPSFTDCAVDLNGRGSGSRYDGTYRVSLQTYRGIAATALLTL